MTDEQLQAENAASDYYADCDPDEDEETCCPYCGKDFYEFSDYGCTQCDVRVSRDMY